MFHFGNRDTLGVDLLGLTGFIRPGGNKIRGLVTRSNGEEGCEWTSQNGQSIMEVGLMLCVPTKKEAHNTQVDEISCSVDFKTSFYTHPCFLNGFMKNMAIAPKVDDTHGHNNKDLP